MGADPIAVGLVASLNQPGANLTGVTSLNVEVGPKRLEILREIVPTAAAFAVLINPTTHCRVPIAKSTHCGPPCGGATPRSACQHRTRLRSCIHDPAPIADGRARNLVRHLLCHAKCAACRTDRRFRAIHQSRDFTIAGGLMSYGGSYP